MSEEPSMRLDKWLKIARFYKQRTTAVDAIENGRVKVNEESVRPSKMVRVGDILNIKIGNQYHKCTIKQIVTRSISARLAKEMYEMELPFRPEGEMAELWEIFEQQNEINRREWRRKGKFDKKERREINRWKYGEEK